MRFWKSAMIAAAAFSIGAGIANAKPQGLRGDDVGKKLWNFNVLVYPNEWSGDDEVCPNNGSRIFFQSDGKGGDVGRITWDLNETENNSFQITDCDGTTDGDANVVVNQSVDILVAVRLLGPPTSSVDLVCTDIIEDPINDPNDDPICIIDSTTIHQGTSFTKIMRSLLDDEFDRVLWDLDFSTGAKNLQVWVMEDLSRQ